MAALAATAMAVETRPELVGKRFLCVAVGEEVRLESGQSGCCWRSWRAGVIRAVSHRDSSHPDLAVRASVPVPPAPPGYLWHLAPLGQLAVTPLLPALGAFALLPPWLPRVPSPPEAVSERTPGRSGIAVGSPRPILAAGAPPRLPSGGRRADTSPKGRAAVRTPPRGQVGAGAARVGTRPASPRLSSSRSLNSAGAWLRTCFLSLLKGRAEKRSATVQFSDSCVL